MHELPNILTERIDDIPLLIAQMQRMGLPTLLDTHFPTHGNWLEGVLKITLGSSPSAAPSAGSSRPSGAFHSSAPSAHNLCSSGAAAPTSPTCVPQSSTTVSRQT